MRPYVVLFPLLGWVVLAWADGSTPVYRVETVAGSCPIATGPAATAQVGTIKGIAVSQGNIYLSDTDNHLVRKVDASGTITTLAGTCIAGFGGDGGPAATAQLNQPYGVAVDSGGNVFVADYGNNRVRRISTDGTISTVAGNGQAGQAGDGGLAVDAQLLTPRNVALDGAGNLYISEFEGNRVRKVSADGKITTFVGIGIAGFAGDGGRASAAQLDAPAGLAVDRMGAVYIADWGNNSIRKVQGGTIDTIKIVDTSAGAGAPNTVNLPGVVGVTVDAAGIIYLAGLNGCGFYNPATRVWTPIPHPASDIAVDGSGNLYLAAGTQVLIANNKVSNVSVGGSGIGDGGSATAAQVGPSAVALDAAGNLHIADTLHNRVRRVNAAGQIGTLAGTDTRGCAGDGGPATAAQLSMPGGVMVDSFNTVFIADAGCHKIRRVDTEGRINTVLGTGAAGLGQEGLPATKMPLSNPQGVCGDNSGTLYVVDTGNNRVLRAAPGANVFTVAGNGSAGYSGDGYLAQLSQLRRPTACALDSAGDLLIADTGNHSIRKVTPDGNISTVVGTGVPGFSGDGGAAVSAALSGPAGIAVDDGGNFYISDTNNHRIRKITPDGVIQTVTASSSAVPISSPAGSALDGSGRLYFADSGTNRVRRLVPETVPDSQPTALPIPLAAVNAASLQAGPVVPGELVSILGQGLGPQVGVSGSLDATGLIPTTAGGTEVRFDGVPAPVLYAQASQVNVQVPYSVAGTTSTNVVVLYNGQQTGALVLPVVSAAPAIFPTLANQDGSVNSQSQPAPQNSVITLYATGSGMSNGGNVSGQPAMAPFAQPVGSVTLTVAGVPAQILYSGNAPGLVGVLQINARTPGGFIPSGQATLVLTVGGASSPPLTIWLE